MSPSALRAHSLAEAYLYLMVTPCSICGKGPLEGSDAKQVGESGEQITIRMTASCKACTAADEVRFRIPQDTVKPATGTVAVFNKSEEPSGLIDLVQWVTLFQAFVERSAKETHKQAAREIALEAAQCLDEALKFFPEGSELAPPDAFFSSASGRRRDANPERFTRSRLLEYRSKLPHRTAATPIPDEPCALARKPWWRFW